MKSLPSPSLTPTSQQAGTTSDNSEAFAPGRPPTEIPVGTQAQPTGGPEHQSGDWVKTPSAGSL